MKISKLILVVLVIVFTFNLGNTQDKDDFEEIIWHIKAFMPQVKLLKIKAIDKEGNSYDVKAIQDSEQTNLLSIKAFIKGKRIPVKMLVSDDIYHPVKAIGDDGTIYDIKAFTDDGTKLPVKGVSKSGNIIHIKAIYQNIVFYNVIAISPDGKTNAVKGIKLSDEDIESTVNGIEIYAHVKSLRFANR